MKCFVLLLAVGTLASVSAANTASAKYGVAPNPPPSHPPNDGASNSIDKCGCHQIVAKLKRVESNLLKLILNLRNKYGSVYSELLDMKKNVKSVSWYVGQSAATGDSINDQLVGASLTLAQIMQSIRDLTINQQSLVTKTFLTESLLDLEGRPGVSTTTPAPENDIVYTSCDDERITETGVYNVQDAFDNPTKVICVLGFLSGTYTVIQNRQDGSTDFYQSYKEYKNGFGDFDGGDYWLGLENIHKITSSGDYELVVLLEDFEKNITYARYSNFSVGPAIDFYPITLITGFDGEAGDSLGGAQGVLFSTFDVDLDNSESNCAVSNRGGWWYTECGPSNLNGLYLKGLSGGTTGMFWETFRGANYSLKKSRMMVRRKTATDEITTTAAPTTTTEGAITEATTVVPTEMPETTVVPATP